MNQIRIQLMGPFGLFVNETDCSRMLLKSPKGVALMEYLILNRGEPVPNTRLLQTLWDDERSTNPENALKTLVSRMRALLNQCDPDLGKCIASGRGVYAWHSQPEVYIDLFELEQVMDELGKEVDPAKQKALMRRMISLYKGDLLADSDNTDWALNLQTGLHDRYLQNVLRYTELLMAEKDYENVVSVCRTALEIDAFNERLHVMLMNALLKSNRSSEALKQYNHVMRIYYRYLGAQPGGDIQAFYQQIVQAGQALDNSVDNIRADLRETIHTHGAFYCDYAMFREVYNLQMRSLERFDMSIFLGVIMVTDSNGDAPDVLAQQNMMQTLSGILVANLRRGDTVAQYSPTSFALLLPTVNYTTGSAVMERIRRLFYQKFPSSSLSFNYRLAPLMLNGPAEPVINEKDS